MPDPRQPSFVALATSACFTASNLAVLLGGGALGLLAIKLSWWLLPVIWVGAGVLFAGRVLVLTQNPAFIAEVARESFALPRAPSAKVLGLIGQELTGKYLESVNRVKQLKDELVGQVHLLPEGPGRDAFLEYVPTLDQVPAEVHRLAGQMQRLEKELSGDTRKTLTAEVGSLEAKLGQTADDVARYQLEEALSKKREALGHYHEAEGGLSRLEARIEAITSALQEARARVTSLSGSLAEGGGADEGAKDAVEGISREVKYLSQTVEDTVKLKLLN